jgi:hypothetical protein
MCWMWGTPLWGWWWIFPAVGFLFMMIMMVLCFGFFRSKRDRFCRTERSDYREDLKREIGELKEEITRLKRTGG